MVLQNAIDAAGLAHWKQRASGAMEWDRRMSHFFGVEPNDTPKSTTDFLLLVAEGDRGPVFDQFSRSLETNQPLALELTTARTGRKLQLTGQPCLLPGTEGRVISGLCRELESGTAISPGAPAPQSGFDGLTNFASVASHELREPLRMVSSYLGLLRERYPDALDARAQRYITHALEGADRMRALIQDLLAYARLEKQAIQLEAIHLRAPLQEAIDNLSTAITESGAIVRVDLEAAPIVRGHHISLVRLFQNLLANAIKFRRSKTAPQVDITFSEARFPEAHWVISVEDQGIGIEADHLPLIFDLFQRLNTRDEFEGSGIGLAVCEKIIERLGGGITCRSEPGRGSCFSVSLPKVPAAGAPGI